MSKPPLDLPPSALERIISHSLSLGVCPGILISQLGSTFSDATKRLLAATLTLPDDDSVLLAIERQLERGDKKGERLVIAVAAEWNPDLVQHLEIVPPIPQGEPPLDDHGFLSLIDRYSNLTSFTWRSHRLPPEDLCLDLGTAAKNLRSFTFDLTPPPSRVAASLPHETPTSSPIASPASPALHSTASHPLSLRWDGSSLSSLPGSLTSLSLSSLSHTGIHELSTSLPSFFALEHLELSKTVFVDDPLLHEISTSLSKSLKRFTVKEMGGTKLSDVGIGYLFEGCGELEHFELECVEGRLSRSCWSKISSFPPRLGTVRIVYSESPPHKSWILDHLQSIPSLLSVPSLTSFTLSRKVHRESLVPGSHHLARHPIDSLLVPRRITRQELEAITEGGASEGGGGGGGKRWNELDLDLVLVDGDALKKLLESCTELKRLKVCFDAQFKNLLSLSSSFSACLHLQRFSVSIPLEHTPELQPLTPSTYLAASTTTPPSISLAGSPSPPPKSTTTLPPVLSPSNSSSSSPLKSLSDLPLVLDPTTTRTPPSSSLLLLPEGIESLLPATRDWRRFLKKSHSLGSITWTGRGGIGKFRFTKVEGKGLIKIFFEPTLPLVPSSSSCSSPFSSTRAELGGGDETGGGGGFQEGESWKRERQDSWTSFSSSSSSTTTSFGGGGTTMSTPFSMRRRRTSTSSATTGSPTSPTKSLGGGGGGASRKFGSIDAAFTRATTGSRRASTTSTTSDFGAVGSAMNNGGGGGNARRKTSFDCGQIGSGWSGFNSGSIPAPPPPFPASIPEDSISPTSTLALLDPFEYDDNHGGGGGGGLQMSFGPSPDTSSQRIHEEAKCTESLASSPTKKKTASASNVQSTVPLVTDKKNPWGSALPSSVTSPTPAPAPIGWASSSSSSSALPPSPPRPAPKNDNQKNGTSQSTLPSSTKMSRSSRSSSSQGSPNAKASRGGTGVGVKETIRGEGSNKKDDSKKRRERGGRQTRGKK